MFKAYEVESRDLSISSTYFSHARPHLVRKWECESANLSLYLIGTGKTHTTSHL